MVRLERILIIVALIFLGGSSALAAPAKKSPPINTAQETALPQSNKIIASIEGEPLTLKDLHDYLKAAGVNTIPPEGTEEFKKLYEDFLTQMLVEKEAKALNIEVGPDDTTAYIEEIKRQNQVNEEQLNKLLISKGMTLPAYRQQIQQEILRTRLTQHHARTTISISDKDVKNQMGLSTESPDEAVSSRHLFQVFVPLEEDGKSANFNLSDTPVGAPEELREQRLEIITQIRDKVENPQDLKKEGGSYYSDLGVVSADDLMEDLREPVLDLDEGEISSVIDTPRGFYLFGLASVVETGPEIRSDDKEAAKKQLFEEKLRTEMSNYISKELPKKYNLERKL